MKKYIYEGKNKEQILNLALYELNVNENELLYNIKEEHNGLLKGKKYIIEYIKYSDIVDYAKEILSEILKNMNISYDIETILKDEILKINIYSEKSSIIIGKKGGTLDSLQTFIRQAILTEVGEYIQIIVDVENYKEKQTHFLQKNAKNAAKEVQKTKIDIKLDPMKAYERKVVHDTLTNFKNIETISEGKEPNRYVIIKYKND